jgi:serine/threonine protein kinase
MQNLIGQTLDGKYAIERELGRGGMGTVYFANHIGTERPVAVKVISPQFMAKSEFVERFRREARAAGRLRHPNVVDVTDFGIAETATGKVAYLVMEYLDGCTLGEILEEEKQIPLSWSLDILEQVCSAVNEAHEQGIIHRDLKPDNIWLEPNQRGGYTVKVLDFGIAKLEEHVNENLRPDSLSGSATQTGEFRQQSTVADQEQSGTVLMPPSATMASDSATMALTNEVGTRVSEANTLIKPEGGDPEAGTAILPRAQNETVLAEDEGTRLMPEQSGTDNPNFDPQTAPAPASDLTRIGAVLGTPLYMSPEQCRGEKLGPRSDIYSLGIISYQMLSGDTPFKGNYSDVMQAHKETPPPLLQVKKVPRRVKKVVMSALSKNPDERPQTAEGFASILRSHSEGMGALLRRGIAIYGEHLPKFFMFSLIIGLPFVLLTFLKVTIQFLGLAEVINPDAAGWIVACLAVTNFFVQIFFGAIVVGATTWIVAQILAMPLRPISVRAAARQVRKRWKPLITAVTINTILVSIGIFICFLPGIWLTTRNMLAAPSIMMEGLSARKSFGRSKILVGRSYWTVFWTVIVMHFVPMLLAVVMSLSILAMARSGVDVYEKARKSSAAKNEKNDASAVKNDKGNNVNNEVKDEGKPNVGVKIGSSGVSVSEEPDEEDKKEKSLSKTAGIVSQGIFELIWAPIVIFITAFISVITALVYFKTRLAGGESMQDLLAQFEEAERPRTKWQERVRARLAQSGRSSSRSGGKSTSKS